MNKLAADFIFIVHFALVLFIAFGWLISGFFYAHMSLLFLTLISEIFFGYCLLTRLEFGIRKKLNPALLFDKSCIIHYIRKWIGLAPRIAPINKPSFFKRNSFLFIILTLGIMSLAYRFLI